MIIKLAAFGYNKLSHLEAVKQVLQKPQVVKKVSLLQHPVEEALDNANKVIHVPRPDAGRMKSPIRIIEKTANNHICANNICPNCSNETLCRCRTPDSPTKKLCWKCR